MLSDFSTISPVWIRYCITEINMESIERNGLYDQIIIISGKKMKYLFKLLSSYYQEVSNTNHFGHCHF